LPWRIAVTRTVDRKPENIPQRSTARIDDLSHLAA
jgi:hypothetical protein